MKKIIVILKFSLLFIPLCGLTISCNSVSKDWEEATSLNTMEAYNEFLRKHPESEYQNKAKMKIYDLAYVQAISINTLHEYVNYLHTYPDSDSCWAIKVRLGEINFNILKALLLKKLEINDLKRSNIRKIREHLQPALLTLSKNQKDQYRHDNNYIRIHTYLADIQFKYIDNLNGKFNSAVSPYLTSLGGLNKGDTIVLDSLRQYCENNQMKTIACDSGALNIYRIWLDELDIIQSAKNEMKNEIQGMSYPVFADDAIRLIENTSATYLYVLDRLYFHRHGLVHGEAEQSGGRAPVDGDLQVSCGAEQGQHLSFHHILVCPADLGNAVTGSAEGDGEFLVFDKGAEG